MRIKENFIKPIASFVFVIVAIAAIWLTTHVKAFNPQPDPPAFGLISLNPGQSLRLNVVNMLAPPPDPDRLERMTRHTMLGFDMYRAGGGTSSSEIPLNSCPTAHRFADRQSCEVTLGPGEAASFDLAFATEVGATQVLPEVQDDDRGNRPALFYTLEIREGGKTIHVLPAVRSNTCAGNNGAN